MSLLYFNIILIFLNCVFFNKKLLEKKYKISIFYYVFLILGINFFTNYSFSDISDITKYYSIVEFWILPSFDILNGFKWPETAHVNDFSPASKYELVTRHFFMYLKVNGIELQFIPFVIMFFYICVMIFFLRKIKLAYTEMFLILLILSLSKLNLYNNLQSFRYQLGFIYSYYILGLYFFSNKNNKYLFLISLSILFHYSFILILLIILIDKFFSEENLKKNFIYLIILAFAYSSFLLYKPQISEILLSNLPIEKYIVSKISSYTVDSTGTSSHPYYYFINPIILMILLFLAILIQRNKYNLKFGKINFIIVIMIILFSNNTFILKKIIYMFAPFLIILFILETTKFYKNNLSKFNILKNNFFVLLFLFVNLQLIIYFIDFEKNNSDIFILTTIILSILSYFNYYLKKIDNLYLFILTIINNFLIWNIYSLNSINFYL
jgi:hypothetical protein